MGLDTIPARTNSQTIDQDWFNLLSRVLSGDIVPRTGGVATAGAGDLGSVAFPFSNVHTARLVANTGDWQPGDIKAHFNMLGAYGPGHGWMLCDGRQVTQANYDAEHGAGSWATYIVTAAFLNAYLPDYCTAPGKYIVGSPTTQSGVGVPMTSVGNVGHALNFGSQLETAAGASHAPTLVGNQSIQPESIQAQIYMRII